MNESIYNIFEQRLCKAKERLDFAMRPMISYNGPLADIVVLKKYYGLQKDDELLILPVFDEMYFSEDGSVAFGRINDLWTLYDACSGQELIEQSFVSLPVFHQAHHTLEIIVDAQHHGLYDLFGKRLLLEPNYDDVDCCSAYSHLWVKKDHRWGYVNKETRKEVLVYDMDMAYEADGGLFLRRGERILLIDEQGINDAHALRRFVLSHQGRGLVRNAKYHDSVYFDIYGNIIT